ncbi:hypothetical protein BDW59DRAFT_158112 [Aspergillus cavernicola]|uniref:C2H2-type domain-containing protein n=1 Tax=Aspergillus cavernicola TaxID=176166 RepID=A0ABR4ITS0_9EURO
MVLGRLSVPGQQNPEDEEWPPFMQSLSPGIYGSFPTQGLSAQGFQAQASQLYLQPPAAGGFVSSYQGQEAVHSSSTGEIPLFHYDLGAGPSLNANTYGQSNPMEPTQPSVPVINPPLSKELLNELGMIAMFWNSFTSTGQIFVEPNLRDLHGHLRRASSHIENLTRIGPEPDANQRAEDKKFRCIFCPLDRQMKYINRGTFKRHVTSTHWPDAGYQCDICFNAKPRTMWFATRKDKYRDHMWRKHQHPQLTQEQMAAVRTTATPPPNCPSCGKLVNDWKDFIDCLCRHCSISEVEDNTRDLDDHDRDDDGDAGNDDGGHHFLSPSAKSYGNIPGNFQYNQGHEDQGTGNGNGSYRRHHHHDAHGSNLPHDQMSSEASSPETVAPGLIPLSEASSIHENNVMLQTGTHVDPETARQSVSGAGGDLHPAPARGSYTRDLRDLPPRINPNDSHGKDSPSRDEDGRATTCKTCEVCKHTLGGCTVCERLDGALTRCHVCTNETGPRLPIGDYVGAIRPRIIPIRGLNDKSPAPDGLEGTETTHPAQSLFNPSTKIGDSDSQRSELMLGLEWFVRKHQGDSSKRNADYKPVVFGKAVVSAMEKDVSREFQRLRFFEHHLYVTQLQGTFLSCIHETRIVSEPQRLVVSSVQEIVYQKVSLGSEMQPEIPDYHLYYLAREKDHESSEANLQVAHQASPKRRAHLRVRIRAIAGVLALRAAVSKAPPAVDNSEIGDGWEIGVPLSPSAKHEDVVMLLTWLVQFLVIILRMPPNPEIYVMLTSGYYDVARLA